MNKLLSILLICSIGFTQELTVEGDLNVTGTIENALLQQQIADLEALILNLQNQINILSLASDMQICTDEYGNSGLLDICGVCNGDESTCQIADIDGNIYHYISIGDQVWLKENLRSTRYQTGEAIPYYNSDTDWSTISQGALSYYNDDQSYSEIYGNLYNWYAVNDSKEVCPLGFHAATSQEWLILIDYLGGEEYAGGALKDTGSLELNTGLWNEPNVGASNSSNFTALPAGARFQNSYNYLGSSVTYWASNTNTRFVLQYGTESMYITTDPEWTGYSVRCIQD